ATELGTTVGQHPRQPDTVLVIERHHPVVEDLGRGDRRLTIIELGEGDLGIGVDEGLLVDPSHPLQCADIEGVLCSAEPGYSLSNSPWASLSAVAFSSAAIWASVSKIPSCATLASSALRRCFIEARSWRRHPQPPPAGEIDSPRRLSASETRTWPQAGGSIASATAASSISIGVRFFRIGLRRLISCNASSPPLSYSSLKR